MLFKLLMKEISLKTVYNTKIKQGEDKIHNQDNHVTVGELNICSSDILDGKLKEAKFEAKKFLKLFHNVLPKMKQKNDKRLIYVIFWVKLFLVLAAF